jgi:peptidoglycan/xylan/chitin deacetylase (PgdA/CDA1 family)
MIAFLIVLTSAYLIPYTRQTVKAVALDIRNSVDRHIPVLIYHQLLKEHENRLYKNNNMVLNVDEFEKQMQLLHDNGYNTINTQTLYKYSRGEIKLPKKTVLITFDDGYEGVYKYAYPILKKYGFNATVFLITSNITETSEEFNPDQLQFMSRQTIQNASDVFEFGSHTYQLHNLDANKNSVFANASPKEIKEDLSNSNLKINTTVFAYPYGMYNETNIDVLKETGFIMAFTTKEGLVTRRTNLYKLPRHTVYSNTSIEFFKRMVGIYK